MKGRRENYQFLITVVIKACDHHFSKFNSSVAMNFRPFFFLVIIPIVFDLETIDVS